MFRNGWSPCIISMHRGSQPRLSNATAASCARATRTRKWQFTATSPKAHSTPTCGRPRNQGPVHRPSHHRRQRRRRAEDIGGQELSYAEVKAIASGNPAVLTLAEADAEFATAHFAQEESSRRAYVARRSVRDLPATIASLYERISKLTADEATANAHARDPITIGKRSWSHADATRCSGFPAGAMPKSVREITRVPLGI